MSIKDIKNADDFKKIVKKIQDKKSYKNPIGFGIAAVDRGQLNSEKILQANFAYVNWEENFGSAAIFMEALKESGCEIDTTKSEFVCDVKKKFVKTAYKAFKPFLDEAAGENHKNVQVIRELFEISKHEGLEDNYKMVFVFEDEKPQSVEAVYIKLYALSLGKAKLRSLNLDGAFGVLENVAWSMNYPIELEWLREKEIELKLNGTFPVIDSVDKFPRFLQHVIPHDNTRILDAAKVRMGAQLAAGTTVMPGASYVNFNAGTEGSVMIEGRVSSSAVVGEGSDVGGGASILGVLSGTNGNPVSIGKNTLLGANSVTGIPLGDGCIVDAGIAVLEGTKVTIPASHVGKILSINPQLTFKNVKKDVVIKALDLGSCNGIHFRQNSLTGALIALRSVREVKLNADLH